MVLAFVLASISAQAADPSLNQVYQAAQSGNLGGALGMMDQVLRDHPNSAKAHFVEAELLAKEGRKDQASSELATAERLAPGLPFATPAAVGELRTVLAARSSPAPMPLQAAAPASSLPWGMLIVGGGLLAAILFFISRFRAQSRPLVYSGAGPVAAGQAWGPGGQAMGPTGYGNAMPPASGGFGSGLMGSLATGAAMGAGVVAGEALMHRVFDGGQRSNAAPDSGGLGASEPAGQNYDMGGNDFGLSDNSGWDDSASSGGSDDWS